MTLERLQKYIETILKRHPDYAKSEVVIQIHVPKACGTTPHVHIKDVATGFDWDSGYVFLIPTQTLEKQPEPGATIVHERKYHE